MRPGVKYPSESKKRNKITDPNLRMALRICQTIEQDPAKPLIPKYDHDDVSFLLGYIKQDLKRLQKAARKGYVLAYGRSVVEVLDDIKSLESKTGALRDAIRVGWRQYPKSMRTEIYNDLVGFTEEFGGFEFDEENHQLSVKTHDITLSDASGEEIELGPFRIELELWELRMDYDPHKPSDQTRFKVRALQPNRASGRSDVTHPHVCDHDLCTGEATAALSMALKEYRYFDFFTLVRSVLDTYNSESPYVEIGNWNGMPCKICDDSMSEGDVRICDGCESNCCCECGSDCDRCDDFRCCECRVDCSCDDCEKHMCKSCANQHCCRACGYPACSDCMTRCYKCSGPICKDCKEECEACGRVFCSNCLSDNKCSRCSEEGNEDDSDSNDQGADKVETGDPAWDEWVGNLAAARRTQTSITREDLDLLDELGVDLDPSADEPAGSVPGIVGAEEDYLDAITATHTVTYTPDGGSIEGAGAGSAGDLSTGGVAGGGSDDPEQPVAFVFHDEFGQQHFNVTEEQIRGIIWANRHPRNAQGQFVARSGVQDNLQPVRVGEAAIL